MNTDDFYFVEGAKEVYDHPNLQFICYQGNRGVHTVTLMPRGLGVRMIRVRALLASGLTVRKFLNPP